MTYIFLAYNYVKLLLKEIETLIFHFLMFLWAKSKEKSIGVHNSCFSLDSLQGFCVTGSSGPHSFTFEMLNSLSVKKAGVLF